MWSALVSIAAMGVGVPGSDLGMKLVLELTGSHSSLWPDRKSTEASESAAGALEFRQQVFESRPAPTPSPTITPTGGWTVADSDAPDGQSSIEATFAEGEASITDIIYAAAEEFGLDGDYLLSVAECESGLDPSAYNPAGYYGLFQFDDTTWAANGYGSIYDPVAQARTAARLIAAGEASRWPNCA